MATTYDDIVIGSGQAGGPLASALARSGRRVALIERAHVGGTCVNEGCTPTKTMVASARVAYLARRAADYGVHTGPITIDMEVVRQRKRTIVEEFRNGSQRSLESTEGLDLLMGEARFCDRDCVIVRRNDGAEQLLKAERILINTGLRPSQPDLPGLKSVPTLDSTSIMELDHVPEHLIVLGGGYIGLEFGQMFRRFGSAVTIVQRGAQLLPREDADIAEAVAEILRDDGITVLLNSVAKQVTSDKPNRIALTVTTPDGERTLNGSHLLVATGRVPNSDALNLAAAGVATDARGFITVNERLETNVPGIYALGDVKGGPAFTHISYDDFRILRTNLIEGGNATTRDRLLPYVVFIDPQLGRIGMSENEARKAGRQYRVATMPMTRVARALETAETRGVIKVLVDANDETILGGAVLGIEGGELISQLQLAMMGNLGYSVLRDAVFAHPALAELWNNLFASL